jgi:hypothetical protein
MLIRKETQMEIEAILKAEFERINRRDNGRPMTLREMENLVTEVGQHFHEKMLGSVIAEQKNRTASEKKLPSLR